MQNDYYDQFFQRFYEAEFERKDQHDAADTFYLTAITILGSILLYYLHLLPKENFDRTTYVFAILAGAFSIAWTVAVFCVLAAVRPREVGYIATAKELQDYLDNLAVFHGYNNTQVTEAEAVTQREFQRTIRQQFIDASSLLRQSNHVKLMWQSRAKRALTWAVVILLVNAIPMAIIQRSQPEVQQIQIVGPNDLQGKDAAKAKE